MGYAVACAGATGCRGLPARSRRANARRMTALDHAHAAMIAAPQDEAARLAYFGALADAALWLWLEAEAEDDRLSPRVFDLPDGPAVLAFDTPERLAEVAGAAAYAELPGRVVAQALAGQGVALGVNLGAEAPSFLVPPEAVDWLATLVTAAPEGAEVAGGAEAAGQVVPPGPLPDALGRGLVLRLRGLAAAGALVRMDGALTLVLTDAAAEETALARAAGEAAAFAAWPEPLGVAFARAGSALDRAAQALGRALDLTPPAFPPPAAPRAPGTDPERPPKLR